MDPEYYQSFMLNKKSDIYSFGVVLFELITGMKAIDRNREKREVTLADMVVPRIQMGLLEQVVDPVLGVDRDAMEGVRAVA
ncbi:protein kinase, partial [Shigella flexneri]|nr:protein kinase [Shigella flexneri]